MSRNKSFRPYKLKADAAFKRDIDMMLDQLKRHGRAIVDNGKSSRRFATTLRNNSAKNSIIFSWDRKQKKSIVTLYPGYKLVQGKGKRIKIIYDKE